MTDSSLWCWGRRFEVYAAQVQFNASPVSGVNTLGDARPLFLKGDTLYFDENVNSPVERPFNCSPF